MGARGWAPLSCRGPSRLPRPPPSSGSTGTPNLARMDSQLPRCRKRARHSGPAPVPPNPQLRGRLEGAVNLRPIGLSGPFSVYPSRILCEKCASTSSNGSILYFYPLARKNKTLRVASVRKQSRAIKEGDGGERRGTACQCQPSLTNLASTVHCPNFASISVSYVKRLKDVSKYSIQNLVTGDPLLLFHFFFPALLLTTGKDKIP